VCQLCLHLQQGHPQVEQRSDEHVARHPRGVRVDKEHLARARATLQGRVAGRPQCTVPAYTVGGRRGPRRRRGGGGGGVEDGDVGGGRGGGGGNNTCGGVRVVRTADTIAVAVTVAVPSSVAVAVITMAVGVTVGVDCPEGHGSGSQV
jgi:hypothetical protein